MWDRLTAWLERSARRRRQWRADARYLWALEGRLAYYEAHRRAARARVHHHSEEFRHWTRVAAEIARIAPDAEMDINVLRRVVDTERERHRLG